MHSRGCTARRAALLMVAVLLIGACSAAGPTAAEPGGSETPPAPVLSSPAIGDTTVTVSWMVPDTNLAVSGYELRWRRDRDSDSSWSDVRNIPLTDTSYTITDLDPDTAYVVQVRAVFSDGAGEWSHPLPVTTGSETTQPTMGAPALSEPTVGPTSVTVTWTPPQTTLEIQGYELRWRPSSESDWTDVGDIPRTDTSYTITDLDPDTAYVVQVRAAFADGFGDWSSLLMPTTSVESGTQSPPTPQTPRPTLSSGPVTQDSVTVTWMRPQTTLEIQSYELRWRPGSESGWNDVDSTTDTSYTIRSLAPGTTYVVQVRAVYASDGGASPWAQVTTTTGGSTESDSVPTVTMRRLRAEYSEDLLTVSFQLRLSHSVDSALTVTVNVSETGDMLMNSNPVKQVIVPSMEQGKTFSNKIVNDTEDEPNSVITATIQPGNGYDVGTPASASLTVTDDD